MKVEDRTGRGANVKDVLHGDISIEWDGGVEWDGGCGYPEYIPTPREILRRTPHIDIDPPSPTEAGARIQVYVYTDRIPWHQGEDGEDIVVEIPPNQAHIEVSVWLVAEEPFEVEGPDCKKQIITCSEERSEPTIFTVIRRPVAAEQPIR